jgi:hypothetical protein
MADIQSLVYFLLEAGIFIIVVGLILITLLKFHLEASKIRAFILMFLIMYGLSVFFSALTKYIKYRYGLMPADISTFSMNYFVNVVLYARIKYVFTVLANFAYFLAFYEIVSIPKSFYSRLIGNLTSVLITLYLVPVFSARYNLFLSIALFLHSLLIYIPIIYKTRQIIPNSSSTTCQIMRTTFIMSLLLSAVLLIALLDRISTSILSLAYSFFYYLAWGVVLFVIFFAFKLYVFSDWHLFTAPVAPPDTPNGQFIDRKMGHADIDAPLMLIICPHCKTARYHLIPESTQLKVNESPSGITTMLIKEQDFCGHTFLVYFDRNYKVRSVQKVDIIP